MRRIALVRMIASGVVSTILLSAANAQEKHHQATGTIGTSSPTQLVLLKQFGRNQAHWNFVLNPKTKLEGKLTKGERVRIYYYDDPKGQRVAEQVKIIEQASAPPAAPAKAAPGPQSQSAH